MIFGENIYPWFQVQVETKLHALDGIESGLEANTSEYIMYKVLEY